MKSTQQATGQERPIEGANFVLFGGSSGIGRAVATALAQRGAALLIVARGRAEGEATVAQLRASGAASADFLRGDLSSVAGIQAVAAGIQAWRPTLHGVLHTAMAAFNGKRVTTDGFEFAFALQYFARATLNRLLLAQLVASGDGRIVHIAGNVPASIRPDLDDLQYERHKWSFFKAVLGSHALGFLHIQEAARRWQDLPVSITAACVGPTKTKAMADPAMPLIMRLMGLFGTQPEISARNAVRLLTTADSREINGSILRQPKHYRPEALALDPAAASELWQRTTQLAQERGLLLP